MTFFARMMLLTPELERSCFESFQNILKLLIEIAFITIPIVSFVSATTQGQHANHNPTFITV
jgi:hypothetical protein